VTDSGRSDAAVNAVVAGDGDGVAAGVGVSVGSDGVVMAVVGGLTMSRGSVWLLHPDSTRHATTVARPKAANLIPMPVERWVVRLGSATAHRTPGTQPFGV
jgi:hypothetical protein